MTNPPACLPDSKENDARTYLSGSSSPIRPLSHGKLTQTCNPLTFSPSTDPSIPSSPLALAKTIPSLLSFTHSVPSLVPLTNWSSLLSGREQTQPFLSAACSLSSSQSIAADPDSSPSPGHLKYSVPASTQVRGFNIPALKSEEIAKKRARVKLQRLGSPKFKMKQRKLRRRMMASSDSRAKPGRFSFSESAKNSVMSVFKSARRGKENQSSLAEESLSDRQCGYRSVEGSEEQRTLASPASPSTTESSCSEGHQQLEEKQDRGASSSGLRIKLQSLDAANSARREMLVRNFFRCDAAEKMHVRRIILLSTFDGRRYVEMRDSFVPKQPLFYDMPTITVENLEGYFANHESAREIIDMLWTRKRQEWRRQRGLFYADDLVDGADAFTHKSKEGGQT